MKHLLAILFILATLSSFGQGFPTYQTQPVSVSSTVNTIQIGGTNVSLFQLAREGMAFKASTGAITTNQSSNTVSFGTSLAGSASLAVKPGRAALITNLGASSSSGPVQAYSSFAYKGKPFGSVLLGQSISGIDVVFGVNGGSQSVSPNILLGSEGNYDVSFKWLGASNSPYPYCSGSIQYIDFTADFHFDAKKVVLIGGESTSWQAMETDPGGVAYPGDNLYGFRLCDSLRSQGKSVRLINKAFGSATSNDIEYARRSNFYDVDYDLMVISLAINDANAGTTQAVYQQNLKNMILHRNRHRPNASIVFMSCPPTDVNVANYRTWMQAVANDATLGTSANKVYFCDGSAAFSLNATPTADLNFAVSNRTTGNRIHYSGPGHNYIFLNLFQTVKTTNFFTATSW